MVPEGAPPTAHVVLGSWRIVASRGCACVGRDLLLLLGRVPAQDRRDRGGDPRGRVDPGVRVLDRHVGAAGEHVVQGAGALVGDRPLELHGQVARGARRPAAQRRVVRDRRQHLRQLGAVAVQHPPQRRLGHACTGPTGPAAGSPTTRQPVAPTSGSFSVGVGGSSRPIDLAAASTASRAMGR